VRLFERVSNLPEAERAAFLEACGEPPEVVAEAKVLLVSDAAATEGFPALDPSGSPTSNTRTPPANTNAAKPNRSSPHHRVGPYRLLEELGRGGMGTVYLGERDDGQFEDRVAVKVLHGLHSAEQRRRFLVERQILASLRHPHIAYLLDGGLGHDGLPYLVMEVVHGEPIDSFCRRRALTVAQRLRLFLQVASAVEFAHRNLVVHRDIKPSNVLVVPGEGGSGTVKLLDFGIAKILDEGAVGLTRTGHRMMAPSYASPEQVRGESVTTASDVYQLGVLLYELLVGRLPYRFDSSLSPLAMAMAVLESEPELPSRSASRAVQVASLISQGGRPKNDGGQRHPVAPHEPAPDFPSLPRSQRADLDAIVLGALAKEPERRCGSVRELGDDIERFLDGRPVEARGEGRLYRLGKWVRRHRAATVAAVAAVLLVVSVTVSGAVAVVQARYLEIERSRAEAEAAKANLVADFLADVFAGANPENHNGQEATARNLLELGASRIGDLEAPEVQLELTAIMARAFSGLGDQERGRELAEKRLELAREVGASAAVAAGLEELSTIDRLAAAYDSSAGWLDEAGPLRERAVAAATSAEAKATARSQLAGYLRLRGELERDRGRLVPAAEALSRACAIYAELGEGATSREDLDTVRQAEAWALTSLTGVRQYLGEIDQAETLQRRALGLYEQLEGEESLEALNARHNLAMILWQKGEAAEAVPMNVEVIAGFRKIYGGDHLNVAAVLGNQAVVLQQVAQVEEALAHLEEALGMQRRILPADHPSIASSLHNLGSLALLAGQPEQAEGLLREALAMRRKTIGAEHPNVAKSAASLADALRAQDRLAESLALRREALAIYEASLPADHPSVGEARTALEQALSPAAPSVPGS
jgi:serine/threonine-protein kinase